jgi:signal transduction histidine kinase
VVARRERVFDWAIALGLIALAQFGIWVAGHPASTRPVASLFAVAASLPLAWRRRWPLVAHGVSLAALTVWLLALYDVRAQEQPDVFPWFLLIAYGLAVHGSRRQAVIGGGALAGALLLLALPALLAGHVPDAVYSWGIYALAFGLGRALRSRRRAASEAEQRADRLQREREERARQAATAERARLTREIHDVIAHDLSVIVVQAAAERRTLGDDETSDTARVLASIEHTARRSLTELRRLLGVVRREDTPGSRAATPSLRDVEGLVQRVRDAGLDAHLAFVGEPADVPPDVGLCAYRITQEALTNVLKHADASRVEITVRSQHDGVGVQVTDDGRGPVDADGLGHGLANMRERVALHAGKLRAGPGLEGGFEVVATLPYEQAVTT